MKNVDLYSFGPDGTLWTRTTGGNRRPSSVEEMEGYCRLILPPVVRMTPLSESRIEGVPVAVAV